jgi:diguanylate cyclase (GGDEF)-like protein/PAS domain S-box-containing protein
LSAAGENELVEGLRGPRGLVFPTSWRPGVLVVAVLTVVVVLAVDLADGGERIIIGTLILPTLLTVVTLSPRLTALVAGLSVASALWIVLALPAGTGSENTLRLVVLLLGSGACIWGSELGAQVQSRARDLAANEHRYRTILETAEEGIAVLDSDGLVVFTNSRLAEILGMETDEMLRRPAADLLGPTGLDEFRARVSTYRAGRHTRREVRHRRPDGRVVHLLVAGRALVGDDGSETGLVGFYTDITGRKQAERELVRMALHDELTGLANRALFRDRLGHALASRDRSAVAVLLLDLDQFKAVNDALGHDIGDQLLRRVGDRLLEAVRPFDTVARLGGDEFALVCPDVGDAKGAEAVALRVEKVLAAPIELSGVDLTVTASIGMSVQELGLEPPAGSAGLIEELPDRLLRQADAAMYAAKRHGRARYEVYNTAMGGQASDHLRVLGELRTGLARDELRMHYQPIIDISSGSIRGVESLVRWQHPQRGLLLPAEFLPAAEESGLLVDLGAWVLRAASYQGAAWQKQQALSISVNLSVRELLHRDLFVQVQRLLEESGLPADQLTLEVTETALIADLDAASTVLERLRELSVRVSLDDFGTGYSSLAYLRHLPVDELKLDRSFLVDLDDPQSQAIVSAVIDVAHALDMTVVGEGVEHPAQLVALGRLGCDLAQGYLCGRPTDAAELTIG